MYSVACHILDDAIANDKLAPGPLELNWMPVVVPVIPTPLSDTPCITTLPLAPIVIAAPLGGGAM